MLLSVLALVENLPGVDIHKAQILAIIGSFTFLFFILYQIKSKRIREEYSLIWIFFGFVFIVFSLWRQSLDVFAQMVGVAYPPAALFLLLFVSFLVILIQFSIIISRLTVQNKTLTQEHTLLKHEVEELKKELDVLRKQNK